MQVFKVTPFTRRVAACAGWIILRVLLAAPCSSGEGPSAGAIFTTNHRVDTQPTNSSQTEVLKYAGGNRNLHGVVYRTSAYSYST